MIPDDEFASALGRVNAAHEADMERVADERDALAAKLAEVSSREKHLDAEIVRLAKYGSDMEARAYADRCRGDFWRMTAIGETDDGVDLSAWRPVPADLAAELAAADAAGCVVLMVRKGRVEQAMSWDKGDEWWITDISAICWHPKWPEPPTQK